MFSATAKSLNQPVQTTGRFADAVRVSFSLAKQAVKGSAAAIGMAGLALVGSSVGPLQFAQAQHRIGDWYAEGREAGNNNWYRHDGYGHYYHNRAAPSHGFSGRMYQRGLNDSYETFKRLERQGVIHPRGPYRGPGD